jgi:hypothetical protein
LEPKEQSAARVVSLLNESATHTIRGATLRELLKHHAPDFTPEQYNCKNLRHFIYKNVPQVHPVGQAGMDQVYGLANQSPAVVASPVAPPSVSADTVQSNTAVPAVPAKEPIHYRTNPADFAILRAFKSPNSVTPIIGNPVTGEVKLSPSGIAISSPWIIIPKCNPETHKNIAKAFISTITDSGAREAATKALEDPDNWWDKLWDTARQFSFFLQWGAYRNRELARELDRTLQQHHINKKIAATVADAPQQLLKSTISPSPVPEIPDHDASETAIRKLAIKVVANLPIAELRSLRFPLGDVLDALKNG